VQVKPTSYGIRNGEGGVKPLLLTESCIFEGSGRSLIVGAAEKYASGFCKGLHWLTVSPEEVMAHHPQANCLVKVRGFHPTWELEQGRCCCWTWTGPMDTVKEIYPTRTVLPTTHLLEHLVRLLSRISG
jgi:hypothetical protein